MTDEHLQAIKARRASAQAASWGDKAMLTDIDALLAEVERLQAAYDRDTEQLMGEIFQLRDETAALRAELAIARQFFHSITGVAPAGGND